MARPPSRRIWRATVRAPRRRRRPRAGHCAQRTGGSRREVAKEAETSCRTPAPAEAADGPRLYLRAKERAAGGGDPRRCRRVLRQPELHTSVPQHFDSGAGGLKRQDSVSSNLLDEYGPNVPGRRRWRIGSRGWGDGGADLRVLRIAREERRPSGEPEGGSPSDSERESAQGRLRASRTQ